MNYLLTLSFDGKGFCGWQYQPNARTVQGVISDASNKIFKCPCLVTGCSRTDSGVHALGFVCTVKPTENVPAIDCEKLPLAYSALLPEDVSVLGARVVDDDFHPRYRTLTKEYEYRIFNSKIGDPFLVDRAYRFPHKISEQGIEDMQRAAEYIAGTHDFTSFMASGSKITDCVRTVKFCRVRKEGDMIYINIAADGFLYNMVRIIAGTLLDVAVGKTSPDEMKNIIEAQDRARAGGTATSAGLYLKEVIYE
ncbi:MAG: tRNA pseudouridine(38-40) synthase TruA [Clostridia bacterium]|nr:tRNA pseudouridine(38-40) synthase TruA [Clostridia bacterium]